MKHNLSFEDATNLIKLEIAGEREAAALCDSVIEIVKKFDGKVYNKRFDTAVNAVNDNIRVQLRYNSFDIKYLMPNRSVKSVGGDHWNYVEYDEPYMCGMCIESSDNHRALTPDKRIIAEDIIANILNQKKRLTAGADLAEKQLNNDIRAFIGRKAKLLQEIEQFNNDVDYSLANYFDLRIEVRR